MAEAQDGLAVSLAAGTRCGAYEVLHLVGAGGMGEVYRAHDDRLGRDVALKVLPESLADDAERLARFEQEARSASSLNHANVIAIYDVGTHEGAPYIVSELLEGRTLREVLSAGPLPLRKAVDYARQVASGLAAAHDKRIIHRDLKPENLFLCDDGRVKILDFGLAKLVASQRRLGDEESTQALQNGVATEAGLILGTVGYMAPEQVRGEHADARSDIFAFGAILYEMVAGRSAFRAGSAIETMHAILTSEPPELGFGERRVAPELEQIVRRCLEKDPRRRFQSADDLAFSLGVLVGGTSTTSRAALAAREPGRRGPLTLGVAAVAGLATVAALAVVLLRKPAGEQAMSGTGTNLTFQRLTFKDGGGSVARFAPDGQTVIYNAGWEGGPVEVYSTRLGGPESRRLGVPAPDGLFSVSRTGTLALALGCRLNWGSCRGTLAAMPLAGGAPRELLEDVDFADWDPEGEELAVVRAADGRYRIEYPIGNVLFTTEGWITHLRFSPDGKLIAFCEHPVIGSPAGSVSVVDLEGNRRRISDGWEFLLGLAWSPTGDEIWFNASRERPLPQVWATSLSGHVRRLLAAGLATYLTDTRADGKALLFLYRVGARMMALAPGSDVEKNLSWFDWSTVADLSPDGARLLFYEWGEATNGVPTVYVRPTDGGDAVRLGAGKALALSPDQRNALAVRGGPPRLVILPLGPGEERELDSSGITEYHSARWFPDGRHLLFVGEGKDGVMRSYYQDVDGGLPTPAPVLGVLAVLISPDGERIAGYGLDGERYLCDAGGESCLPIAGSEPGDKLVEWSEDGTSIYVRGADDGPGIDVFRIELESGKRTFWRRIAPHDTAGMLGFEDQGVRLTANGRYYAYTYWRSLNTLYLVDGLR